MRLEGKTVFVAGGSRGIGRAIAQRFDEEGAYVLVGYRRDEEAAAQALSSMERGAAVRVDVRDASDVRRAVRGLLETRTRIDVLVCAAGVCRDAHFAMAREQDFTEVIDTNLVGAMRCAHAVVKPMMAAGGGAIVNVASLAGLRASPGQSSYSASKGGLLALTRTLAAELAPKHVRVNALVPGLIDTGMVRRMDRDQLRQRAAHVPMGRLGEAREVADAALFLASDASRYVTGQALVIDGGLSL